MITIAGGTGRVGSLLTETLIAQGADVRVLTRDPAAASKRLGEAPGLEFARVDFDDPRTLVAGLEGSEAAFLSSGTSPRQVRDEIALIDAALAARVGFLVGLSVGGAQQGIANPVLEWHSEIDAHLKQQDVDWTLLRPATFTDATVDIAAALLGAGVWGGHAGRGRASLIDTRDVAAVAAAVLLGGATAHAGKTYDLTGPKAVSMHDVADVIGGAVEYVDRTRLEQRTVLESLGMPQLRVDVLLGLDDLVRDEVYANPTPTVRALTGAAPRAMEDYVREHLSTLVS